MKEKCEVFCRCITWVQTYLRTWGMCFFEKVTCELRFKAKLGSNQLGKV